MHLTNQPPHHWYLSLLLVGSFKGVLVLGINLLPGHSSLSVARMLVWTRRTLLMIIMLVVAWLLLLVIRILLAARMPLLVIRMLLEARLLQIGPQM
uniref:Uncharacterized protein n=1 Tax=Arundo donax TaxID=35708 RepID=A0A0A8Y6B9_ARUDO